MELQEFIETALTQIVNGVSNAQDKCKESGTIISPRFLQKGDGMGTEVRHVEFDIAVTTSEKASTTGGIGVLLGSIGIGSRKQADDENASLTRIKFSVPIRFRSGTD